MFKMLGIIMILGSTTAFGMFKKAQFLHRVRSLEQMILAIKIMQRELSFNCPKTGDLVKILSRELAPPVCEIFKKLHKIIEIDDGLSVEYKWAKIFREYSDFADLSPKDTEIVINLASVLGKFDVQEQIKSLEYFNNLLCQNLTDAKKLCNSEGNITRAVAVSIGMIIAIIFI